MVLDDPEPPASDGIRSEVCVDRRALRWFDQDIRPVDYAHEFAAAATRLLLVEDGSAAPPWWKTIRSSPTVNLLGGASMAEGLLALQLALG